MVKFNGVQLLIPDFSTEQISGDACPMGYGIWNPQTSEYFSSKFPLYFQDPSITIHIKEFICLIIAAKKWGPIWAGKKIQIYCDNDAVCDTVFYLKPKDQSMQQYLREFLFWVCFYNFHPIVSKIASKENDIADFLSRNFSKTDADNFFAREKLPPQTKLIFNDSDFTFEADCNFQV